MCKLERAVTFGRFDNLSSKHTEMFDLILEKYKYLHVVVCYDCRRTKENDFLRMCNENQKRTKNKINTSYEIILNYAYKKKKNITVSIQARPEQTPNEFNEIFRDDEYDLVFPVFLNETSASYDNSRINNFERIFKRNVTTISIAKSVHQSEGVNYSNLYNSHYYDYLNSSLKHDSIFDKIISSENLVYNGKLNFSPFLGTEDNFDKFNYNLIIKEQTTIRYVNKLDLYNPLNLNVTDSFSVQSYVITNQANNISNVINKLVEIYNLDINSLTLYTDVKLYDYCRTFINKVNIEVSERYNYKGILPIDGEHYYLKLGYFHHNQNLIVANFLVVNFKNDVSYLDSIIYPMRLMLISEDVTYFHELEMFNFLKGKLDKYNIEHYEKHRLLNDLMTISMFNNLEIYPTNKGNGSILKKKIRSSICYLLYYLDEKIEIDEFINLVKLFSKEYYDNEVEYSIINYVSCSYESLIKIKDDRSYINVEKDEQRILTESKGYPKEYFNIYEKKGHYEYK